jgi:hypothetical protein
MIDTREFNDELFYLLSSEYGCDTTETHLQRVGGSFNGFNVTQLIEFMQNPNNGYTQYDIEWMNSALNTSLAIKYWGNYSYDEIVFSHYYNKESYTKTFVTEEEAAKELKTFTEKFFTETHSLRCAVNVINITPDGETWRRVEDCDDLSLINNVDKIALYNWATNTNEFFTDIESAAVRHKQIESEYRNFIISTVSIQRKLSNSYGNFCYEDWKPRIIELCNSIS